MNHRRWALIYIACAGLAVAAACIGGFALVRVSASERAAVAQNQRDQLIRLALARMDAELAPLIAREGARPHFEWRSFYSAENVYTGDLEEVAPGAVLVARPLLTARGSWGGLVRLYFELEGTGELSSPQAPEGNALDLAESGYATAEQIADAADELARLRTMLDQPMGPTIARRMGVSPNQSSRTSPPPRGVAVLNPRAQPATVIEDRSVEQGPMIPTWIGLAGDSPEPNPELVLVRAVRGSDRAWMQGIWLDWPRLRSRLEGAASRVLPGARAIPVLGAGSGWADRRMLGAPIGLEVPPPATPSALPPPAVTWTIAALLAGVIVGVVGTGLALRSAVDLAGRRGRFVSAVTHELRTPLTTFRLYSQMLASGMVRDETKRTEYLRTIEREADRLHSIVESVLMFARLGRSRRADADMASTSLSALTEAALPAIKAAAGEAPLEIAPVSEWPSTTVAIDASGYERILGNLVTNAAKYAEGSPIRVWHTSAGRSVTVFVGDDGPGIPRREERRVFNAFHRAARDAGSATPGLGLGLALSRELARHHGGDLTFEKRRTRGCRGAVFALRLPGT